MSTKCPHCGTTVEPSELLEVNVLDNFEDDDELELAPPMIIEGECDCINEETHPDGDHKCERIGRWAGNGGMCLPCLFGCAP